MSCGGPHEVDCAEVLAEVWMYLDAECDDQGRERELPREQEERADEEEQPRGGLDGLGERGQQERLDRVQAARDAAEHVTVAAFVERIGLEALKMIEELGPDGHGEPLPDPGGDVLVAEGEDRAGQRERAHRRGQRPQRGEVGGNEDVVHDRLEEPDLDRLDRGQRGREHQSDKPALAERAGARLRTRLRFLA